MENQNFREGTKVEISIDEDGFRGAWFPGKIVKNPSTITKNNNKKVLVEYETLLESEKKTTPLIEEVDLVQIRPTPPLETIKVFNLDDDVDVSYNDGWWEGVVTNVLDNGSKFSVYFRPTREQGDFNVCDLRLHREWVNGLWVPPLVHDVKLLQPMEEIIDKKETFKKGSEVEVSSDEDGFEGAWFCATVMEAIGDDKYLIKYKDLKTEDDTDFVKEEVDSLHIRPSPPKIEKIEGYKLYEEVDGLYNDGWWVGVISKVLGPSKYQVFFKNTDEEMEFDCDNLRPHQDWICGKWVIASEALDLSD